MEEIKPFEKVLVRINDLAFWIPALYGKKMENGFLTSAGWQSQCVRYEGNESLLGTTNAKHEE